ncbi:MAG: hypothetical protein ACYDDT_09100, partial [Sulfuricella sp.]
MRVCIAFFAISLVILFIGLGLHKRRVLRLARQRTGQIEHDQTCLASIASGGPLSLDRVEGFEQAVCLAEAFRAQHFEGVYGRLSAQKAIAQTGIEDVLK